MAAAVLVPALVLTGCGKKKSSDSAASAQPTQSSSSSQPTAKPAATTASSANSGAGTNVNNSELAALVTNFLKAKSFRMAILDGQGTQQVSLDYVAPDKYHLTGSGIESISIGKDTYFKQAGVWIKLPASQASPTSPFGADQLKAQLDELAKDKFTKGATDSVNGTSCQIYNVTSTDGTTSEVCVANGLPIRIKSAGSILIITDYDKVSDIKAPI